MEWHYGIVPMGFLLSTGVEAIGSQLILPGSYSIDPSLATNANGRLLNEIINCIFHHEKYRKST